MVLEMVPEVLLSTPLVTSCGFRSPTDTTYIARSRSATHESTHVLICMVLLEHSKAMSGPVNS